MKKQQRNKQIKLRGARLGGHMPVILAFGRIVEFSIILSFIVSLRPA